MMMRRTADLLIALLLAFVLGACSTIDIQWPSQTDTANGAPDTSPANDSADTATDPAAVVTEPSPIPDIHARLLRQASVWLELEPAARQQEFTDAQRSYAEAPTDIQLVRLGLYATLTTPEQPGTWQKLRDTLRERIPRMDTGDDELHALAVVLLRILDDRERLMAQLTSQNEELQRKLNELKAIEQQLHERESTDIIRTLP